jgi:hypothetical protein
MKKRTYKRMQNRLYREIKRRMELENMPLPAPPRICAERMHVDTLRGRRIVQPEMSVECFELVKKDIANEFTKMLLERGYIGFDMRKYDMINGSVEIEGSLDVVRGRRV